ncbi:MFS transporter [Naasia sp. SYSU D00948]|uniref:MFS transporter n=1 Tax=Naasia sp. SYSU D00948 TaxID=2817379 RepID=UPI001B30E877|nr:MFS transporter [Naasia sp. SYSU D00948]
MSTIAGIPAARRIQRIYLVLLLGNTLAASFIWGINTLFLLDAGLTNLEAFAANAFFTAGMVIFEVPTGVVADTLGRRASYLLGTLTLAVSTVLYWLMWLWSAPFWAWAVVSVLLGLGFTFFSGAVEAWLVDALRASGYEGALEPVFSKGMVVSGAAMLLGSVAGGVVAQWTDLGVPFLVRAAVLVAMFAVAFLVMRDLGFTPDRSEGPLRAVRTMFRASLRHGLGNPPVRYMMLAAPFNAGVGIYVFYALQPYLLELWGDEEAYSIAGLAAAIVAGSQITGGVLAPAVRRMFRKRTTTILLSVGAGATLLVVLGVTRNFWLALVMMIVWGVASSIEDPIRQAYVNDLIPSRQRATVLSFDSLMGNVGGVVIQPALGRTADVSGYPFSLVVSGIANAAALPFLYLSRRQNAAADVSATATTPAPEDAPAPAPGLSGDVTPER